MLQTFDVSAAVFMRGLTQLKAILTKGEAHDIGVTAALTPGMQDLAAQVYWASEGSRLALERMLGVSRAPATAPSATTFAELHASIDGVIAYLDGLDPAALEAALDSG